MNPDAVVTAICRVHQIIPDAGRVGSTAIDKRPVTGPVRVTVHGIVGDVCLDHEHHGSPDQAVYVYSDEAAAEWESSLGVAISAGQFGENLRVSGLAVDDAVVGTVWRIGDGVLLEVTNPRIPCATFARWMNEPRWVRRFSEMGLPGTYARVLQGGTISTRDPIVVTSVPEHGVTIRDLFADPSGAAARMLNS